MTWEKVGLDLNALTNITAPNLTLPTTSQGLVSNMISQATSTGIWFEVIILTSIFVILWWALGESSPLSSFRYSYLRASNLALGITCVIGITLLLTGIADSFRIVAIYLILDVISLFLVLAMENKE